MVREARYDDLHGLLELYLYLHETDIPEDSEHLTETWNSIYNDDNHHLIVYEEDGKIVSACNCLIVPNLTRGIRPYAIVENVVTHGDYRKCGFAHACLDYAKEIAVRNNCYRIMLCTGSKDPETLHFYENAGYNRTDKTAFNQWLNI